jgi:hypothetical protein
VTDYQKVLEDICAQPELLKLLTIGRKDKSGDFIPGAGLNLKSAVFLVDAHSHWPYLKDIYELIIEIQKHEATATDGDVV